MTYKQSNKPVIHGPFQINFRIKTEKYDLIIETVGMWLEKKLNNSRSLNIWTPSRQRVTSGPCPISWACIAFVDWAILESLKRAL